jgi:hypothetical protein
MWDKLLRGNQRIARKVMTIYPLSTRADLWWGKIQMSIEIGNNGLVEKLWQMACRPSPARSLVVQTRVRLSYDEFSDGKDHERRGGRGRFGFRR